MKKIRAFLEKTLERTKRVGKLIIGPVTNWVKDENTRRCCRYARYYKYLPIKKKTVLYESFFGKGLVCNPYALFREMLFNPKYKDYTHIWALDNLKEHEELIKEYSSYKKVKFVEIYSRQYLKYLASAEILINNTTFHAMFVKKEGQIYINTWHGIPLKGMGYDMPDGAITSRNMIRNFLQADYLLSACSFMTEMYTKSYKLGGLYTGAILEEGYPRNDLLKSDREYVLEKLNRAGVNIDTSKKIILYAPTWRGSNYSKPSDDVDELLGFRNKLMALIDTDMYQVIIKPHNALRMLLAERGAIDYVVPAIFDANEVLSVSDILISDYSSIYFDFLATGRPILFYITDEEEYRQYRGFSLGLDQLPAEYTNSVEQIADWVNHIESFSQENSTRYKRAKSFCETCDVENISSKILSIALEKKSSEKIIKVKSDKIHLQIYKASPLPNGIATATRNLLSNIDYGKYDVTLYMFSPTDQAQRDFVNSIDPNCRTMLRISDFTATLFEKIRLGLAKEYTFSFMPIRVLLPKAAYKREIARCFGQATFDYVIDFDGYSRIMDLLAIHTPAKKHIIWQHNDLHSEMKIKFSWLRHIFSVYPKFDNIVACCEDLMKVNRANLSTPETYSKFAYCENLIDCNRIRSSSEEAKYIYKNNREYYIAEKANGTLLIPLTPEMETKTTVSKCYDRQNNEIAELPYFTENSWRNDIVPISITNGSAAHEKMFRFITVGRCSVEKNQKALIDAFCMLLKEYPNCLLYIVGDGPQHADLYKYILKKGVEKNILMTGNINNPFGLMQKCDCFILPSLHEGMPMVILEARVLHMPIIVSNFTSVKSSTLKNGQMIIGTSVNEIADGMRAFINGDVPSDYEFDTEQYNAACMRKFESLLQ